METLKANAINKLRTASTEDCMKALALASVRAYGPIFNRMVAAGISKEDAIRAIIKQNIRSLEGL